MNARKEKNSPAFAASDGGVRIVSYAHTAPWIEVGDLRLLRGGFRQKPIVFRAHFPAFFQHLSNKRSRGVENGSVKRHFACRICPKRLLFRLSGGKRRRGAEKGEKKYEKSHFFCKRLLIFSWRYNIIYTTPVGKSGTLSLNPTKIGKNTRKEASGC